MLTAVSLITAYGGDMIFSEMMMEFFENLLLQIFNY